MKRINIRQTLYHARESLGWTSYENDALPVCICVAVLLVLKLNRHTVGLPDLVLGCWMLLYFLPSFLILLHVDLTNLLSQTLGGHALF